MAGGAVGVIQAVTIAALVALVILRPALLAAALKRVVGVVSATLKLAK